LRLLKKGFASGGEPERLPADFSALSFDEMRGRL